MGTSLIRIRSHAARILALALLLALPGARAMGQDQPPPLGPYASGRGLFKGITLTEQQRVRLDSLHTRHQAEMQTLWQGRTQAQRRDPDFVRARDQLREQHRNEVRTVLKPEQQKVFDRNRVETGRRAGGGAGPSGGARWSASLLH